MPTRAALATEPTPSTIVQKMTGWIIILIRATKPVPSGFSSDGEVGRDEADEDAERHGDDDRDVEVVGPVLAVRVLRAVAGHACLLCESAGSARWLQPTLRYAM